MELSDDVVRNLYINGEEYLRLLEKVPFNSSPSNFINAAKLARREKRIAMVTDASVRVTYFTDSGREVIYFFNLGFGERVVNRKVTLAAYGSIEAIPAPNNTALVSIFHDYRFKWEKDIQRWWAQLREGIESQGWLFITQTAISASNEIDNINVENLTPSQKELLFNLVQADEGSKSPQPGYVNVLLGDDIVQAPRFGDKPLHLRDFETLCDEGLLVLEEKRNQTRKYRIKDVAYKVAKSLMAERQAQEPIFRRNITDEQLALIGWGKWHSDIEVLDASLHVFSKKYEKRPYDPHAFMFYVSHMGNFNEPLSQAWMIGPHSHDESSLMTLEFEPGKFGLQESLPYAEVIARQVDGFLRVEVWHNGRYKRSLFPYLYALWDALIGDGFEVVWVEGRPYEKNFYDWMHGEPPFAEGEKANQSVERWSSGVMNEVSKDEGEETAVTSQTNEQERTHPPITPQMLKEMFQRRSEEEIEQIALLTRPITANIHPLRLFATWLEEFARKQADHIHSESYVPSATVKDDGTLEFDPVEPVPPAYRVVEADERVVVFTFGGHFYRCKSEGDGRVSMRPDGRLRINVKGQKVDWPNLVRVWERLTLELYRDGWITELPDNGENIAVTSQIEKVSEGRETALPVPSPPLPQEIVISEKSLEFLQTLYRVTGNNPETPAMLSWVFARWREKWPNDTYYDLIVNVGELWRKKLLRLFVKHQEVVDESGISAMMEMNQEIISSIYFRIRLEGIEVVQIQKSGEKATKDQESPIQPQEAPDIQKRRQKVKELYLANELKIWQIANCLGVSEATINRDLDNLESFGEIKRKRKRK